MSIAMRFSRSAATLALMAAGLGAVSTGACAFELSAPIVHGNLSVYPIHDRPGSVSPVEPIDQALRDGRADIVETHDGYAVKNMSGGSLLVPFGMLLRGGSQDQVVAASQIIPPHADLTPIDTYCVDPFRTTPRDGESPLHFKGTGLLAPSLNQRLSLLVGVGHSGPVTRLRQAGVWWSIDTFRSNVSAQTGAPLAPRSPAHWTPSTDSLPGELMQARAEHWTDGLNLALDDGRLAQLEQPIGAALARAPGSNHDVIGAAIAIDGRWVGAELFQSHALFVQMWPMLARSYAIESIAERGAPSLPPLGAEAMKALLDDADTVDGVDDHNGAMRIRDGLRAVVTDVTDPRGRSVAKTYVPKPDPASAARTPDGFFVAMLSSGQVEGRSIDTVMAAPILTNDGSPDRWRVQEWRRSGDVPTIDGATEDFAALPLFDQALLSVLAICLLGLAGSLARHSRLAAALRRGGLAALAGVRRHLAGLSFRAMRGRSVRAAQQV